MITFRIASETFLKPIKINTLHYFQNFLRFLNIGELFFECLNRIELIISFFLKHLLLELM